MGTCGCARPSATRAPRSASGGCAGSCERPASRAGAKKRWRTTTVADPQAEAAKDLIQRHFGPCEELDRRYVGDITYVATWEGWAYLATVIDLASRRVVGWALADHMRTELVEEALQMAFVQRRPPEGVIFHSDRGCQGGINWSSQHPDSGGVECATGIKRRQFACIGGRSPRRDDPPWRGEKTGSSSGPPSRAA